MYQPGHADWGFRKRRQLCDPPPQQSTSPAHPEDSVEGEFAQFRSHGGLGQLGHCVLRIFHTVTGLESREQKNSVDGSAERDLK